MTINGGKPHPVGDVGQRYEISYLDAGGKRCVIGWTNSWDGAMAMSRAIEIHPVWNTPEILDRQGDEGGAAVPCRAT